MSTPPILYLDATLRPNRSLSRGGFFVLMAILAAFNGVMAVFFLVIGAVPIPFFLGLDLLGVWIAFRVSYRRAGRAERVKVSADQVTVAYEEGPRARTVWASPTAFTRVAVQGAGEHEARVRLRTRDRGLAIGDRLAPEERTRFAEALERAIAAARRERWSAA